MNQQCNVITGNTYSMAGNSYTSRVLRYAKKWGDRMGEYYNQLQQRRIDRAAFEQLLQLDDDTLRDIGVTRADVIWAANLPLSQDASCELNYIARRNAGKL